MKRLALILICALALVGCAKVTMTTKCPSSSIGVSFALAGSTVGNQAIAMLGSAVSTGMLATTKEGAAPPPVTSASMTYSYLPIFGADSGSLTCITPPQQTVVITSPPASIVR